ncbi:CAP domain containing protein, partial [Asbolus verrucosus]
MKQIFLLCCWLCLQATVKTDDFDPSKFDYCSMNCGKNTHTACKCDKLEGERTEIFDNIATFRKTIVEEHNRLRNSLAGGGEKSKGFPTAANMKVLNYDLELEYIAICLGKVFYKGHDPCRHKHDSKFSGQNLFGVSKKNDTPELHRLAVRNWYNEINYVVNPAALVSKFGLSGHSKDNKAIGHFTQVIWASITHVGCARVWIPDNPLKAYQFAIICNYGGGNGGNMAGTTVYRIGKPCSHCPDGGTCNDQYKNLCGKSEPIPEREPYSSGV